MYVYRLKFFAAPTIGLRIGLNRHAIVRVAVPSTTTSTASGVGTLSLGAQRSVLEVAAHVVTAATWAVYTGTSPRRRIHKQAFYGVGFTAGAGPLTGVFIPTWWRYLALETEDFTFPAPDQKIADVIFWDIPSGGVMYFEADY